MKTLSKVLSMLLVIVMCVSLFGANAYASGLAPLDGGSQSGGLAPLAPINESDNNDIDNNDDYISGTPLAPLAPIGETTQSVDSTELKPIENDLGIMPFSVDAKVASVGGKDFGTLDEAITELNRVGGTLTIYQDVTLAATTTIDAGKAVTIDLGKNTLALGSNMFYVKSGALTIRNGSITNDDSIAEVADSAKVAIDNVHASKSKFTQGTGATTNVSVTTTCSFDDISDWSNYYNTNSNYTLADSDGDGKYTFEKNVADVAVLTNVNTKKKYKADEIDLAFSEVESGQTLRFEKVSDQGEDYSAGDIELNKAITIDMQNNSLAANITITGSRTLTLKGYELDGTVTLNNGANLTLQNNIIVSAVEANGGTVNAGNAKQIGTLTANGATVNVSGSVEIDSLALNGGTLKMTSGTIGNLAIEGKNTLTVSGNSSVIEAFEVGADATIKNNGISGGIWNGVAGDVATEGDEAYVLAQACATGYEPFAGGNERYTIVKKGTTPTTPTPSQNPGQTTGKFTVYNGRYVKGSNASVYITETTGNQLGGLWIGTKYNNVDNVTDITAYTDSYYSPITIDNSYLDSLNAGTYYLYTYYTNDPSVTKYVGQLTILNSNGGGTDIPDYDGGLSVTTRYTDEWYQGDNALQFYVDPYPKSGQYSTNMEVSIDGKKLGNLDYYDYHNGYFYVGTAKLESLGSGYHTLTVENTKTGAIGSCTFYVGPSLRARDTNKHVIGSGKDLKFVCSEPIASIEVNGIPLDKYDNFENYKLSRDGKTLTLTARFLNERTAGNTYNLSVETINGGEASTTFQILTKAQASSSPKTGDNSNLALWISALVMSGAAAAVIIPNVKRKENEG